MKRKEQTLTLQNITQYRSIQSWLVVLIDRKFCLENEGKLNVSFFLLLFFFIYILTLLATLKLLELWESIEKSP